MRFLADGPAIPDELLFARDEGRVIFFCGAGVSRARARLPDFFGLATNVVDQLHVEGDSTVRKLIHEAAEIAKRVGEGGLISADRIFGLLERHFSVADIHAAVAQSVAPAASADLTAHRILLDLARGTDDKVRLVTTNFDLLFEASDGGLQSWEPSRLPEPSRYDDFHGVIHLHGRVNADYTRSDGYGFVLSSAEFGRAYLSDAWATEFIRRILEKYLVLFVGYTADDPPVQYLLEALSGASTGRPQAYAFQAGDAAEARAKWLHKGVEAIPYEDGDAHTSLWETLDAWASRARDVDAWYTKTISMAQRGPELLAPHERGQVAHIVMRADGARRCALAANALPGEWLCTFDPHVRFSTPRQQLNRGVGGPFVDPFALYGLDGDPVPEAAKSDQPHVKRDVPSAVWDAFTLTRLDRRELSDQNLPTLHGYFSTHPVKLPRRLWYLGLWLSKVAAEPAAAWWASGQNGVHPDVQDQIKAQLERQESTAPVPVWQAWHFIFEAWNSTGENDRDWFSLQRAIARHGWTVAAIRTWAAAYRPYITVSRPVLCPRPPSSSDNVSVRDVASADVKYPHPHEELKVPDDYLAAAVRAFRGNLELATILEEEIGAFGLSNLVPIERDPDLEGDATSRAFGVAVPFLLYAGLFKRLTEVDAAAAKDELLAWVRDDEAIFARLRMWACGHKGLLSGRKAGEVLLDLRGDVFWKSHHQRDLLLTLARRWCDFPDEIGLQLQQRLLAGPPRWQEERQENYTERRASQALTHIHWLVAQGCRFGADIDAETAKLQQDAPNWKREYAGKAAASIEARSGWVKTETEFEPLLNTSLADVLQAAAALRGRRSEHFVQNEPFLGLSTKRPARALAALVDASRRNNYPGWAWEIFLRTDARKEDKSRLSAAIARRIARMPRAVLVTLATVVAQWLLNATEAMLAKYPAEFDALWQRLVEILATEPPPVRATTVYREEPDWVTESLVSPAGMLARALLKDPATNSLQADAGLPAAWVVKADQLLSMSGDARRHALAAFASYLRWFYAVDPQWCETRLIGVLNRRDEDADAAWSGFFSHPEVSAQVYTHLKSRVLEFAKTTPSLHHRTHLEALAGLFLLGWGNVGFSGSPRAVTDDEAREVLIATDEEFRLHVLWQLEKWSENDAAWGDKVEPFLRDVWPLHKKVKTPKTAARLSKLVLSNPSTFMQVVRVVMPLLVRADGQHLLLYDLTKEGGVVEQHPAETLALLDAILPDDTAYWPYQIETTLERICKAQSALTTDEQMLELRRRWNAR